MKLWVATIFLSYVAVLIQIKGSCTRQITLPKHWFEQGCMEQSTQPVRSRLIKLKGTAALQRWEAGMVKSDR
jgi:hypothetical protein